jgi:hypothetical protein
MARSLSFFVPGVLARRVTEAVPKIQDSRTTNGALEAMKEGKWGADRMDPQSKSAEFQGRRKGGGASHLRHRHETYVDFLHSAAAFRADLASAFVAKESVPTSTSLVPSGFAFTILHLFVL